MIPIFIEPDDGWTNDEKLIIRQLAISVYSSLPDVLDKFIVMACLQNEYNQEDVASMVGISQEAISKRIQNIKTVSKELLKVGKL